MDFFGGYRTFGPSENEIARVVRGSRRANALANEDAFGSGLRRIAAGNERAGFTAAAAAPALYRPMAAQTAQQEAGLQQLAQQMRDSRSHVWQEGPGGALLGGLMAAGGSLGGAYLGAMAPGFGAFGEGMSGLADGDQLAARRLYSQRWQDRAAGRGV